MCCATDLPGIANTSATAILDFGSEEIQAVVANVGTCQSHREYVRTAHRKLCDLVTPAYAVDELQPASRTIRKRKGSCSQRMACLEAVARAANIPTRVHALFISREFWYPRFLLARRFMPSHILLLWPQFFLGGWVDFDELHAPMEETIKRSPSFRNDAESLFEAVGNASVDFFGKSCGLPCALPGHDLSRFVVSDEGLFNTRDEALSKFGSLRQTIRGQAFELIFGGRKTV